jgi:hypothetical protein
LEGGRREVLTSCTKMKPDEDEDEDKDEEEDEVQDGGKAVTKPCKRVQC